MIVRIGAHRHSARLRFARDLQEWILGLGPVVLTSAAARRCGVRLDSLSAAEAAALTDSGFDWLVRPEALEGRRA